MAASTLTPWLAVIGTLWADVAWGERLAALRGLHKLLMIPLLLIQFRRSDKGPLVIGAFLASCTLLLAVSWVITIWPGLAFWHVRWSGYSWTGVPFKDYLVQSGEFLLCAFMLAHLTFDAWGEGRPGRAVALADDGAVAVERHRDDRRAGRLVQPVATVADGVRPRPALAAL